jgi:transcriptional regulator with XRE-family HTH domain
MPITPGTSQLVSDPVAERIRRLRLRAGLSLRDLAFRATARLRPGGRRGARGRSVSAPYLSLIENGRKVPDAGIAVAIGTVLGDDPALYAAWIAARKRADLATAHAAVATLARLLVDAPPPAVRGPGGPGSVSHARIRVPVIAAGLDPGEGVRPGCEVLGWRRLDVGALADHHRPQLDRPFAYRLGADSLGRVPGWMMAGDCALVLRGCLPPAREVFAVRSPGRVELARALWNGSQLVLLPAEGESDFVVLDAPSVAELRARVLGAAVAVRFDPEDPR